MAAAVHECFGYVERRASNSIVSAEERDSVHTFTSLSLRGRNSYVEHSRIHNTLDDFACETDGEGDSPNK